jgi:hypothetical protein
MEPPEKRRSRLALAGILAASFGLRAALVLKGGQFYFPDEIRYQTSREAAKALWAGDLGLFLRTLNSADHLLFKAIGTLPASLEIALGENPLIPALFFGLFSVAAIWLVWAIARRCGENERAALFAAGLMALSATIFYYSRHLLPYDLAMAFGLGSLYVGLRKEERWRDSVFCGLLATATFLSYNGYWLLAGFALTAHVLKAPSAIGKMVRRAATAAAAFLFPLALIFAIDYAVQGGLLQQFRAFSGTVTQGSFAEGWSLPLAYLWHAEHGLALLWLAAIVWGIARLAAGERRPALVVGLFGVAFVYLVLAVFSVGLEKFVVYGRLARQLTPFCCLLAALLLERLWSGSRRGRIAAKVVLALAAVQAAANFWQPFGMFFPGRFHQLAAAVQPPGPGKVQVLNAQYIWPYPEPAPPGGQVLLAKPHPCEFLPFQYEGYDPDQRQKLRQTDIAMKVYWTPTTEVSVFADGFESGNTSAWSLAPGGN